MKTLAISNGDLDVSLGGTLLYAQGYTKLVQDLTLWLLEPYGIGFTTPNFGSFLESFIGQADSDVMSSQIQSEIQRILQLYQQTQINSLTQAQSIGQLNSWNKSEIIQSINSISTQVTGVGTTISATISITTFANSNLSLNMLISQNGISVS